MPEFRAGDMIRAGVLTVQKPQGGTLPTIVRYAGDQGTVIIRSYACIGADVRILVGGNHRVDWVSTFPFRVHHGMQGAFDDGHPASNGPVLIDHDAWVGACTTILSGVHIGVGAVVAYGSVVTKDVAPYTIVGGNPAKEIRRRFSDAQIDQLLSVRWWDWPPALVLEAVPVLNGGGVDEFLARYGRGPAQA